jgi:hypothetical protein
MRGSTRNWLVAAGIAIYAACNKAAQTRTTSVGQEVNNGPYPDTRGDVATDPGTSTGGTTAGTTAGGTTADGTTGGSTTAGTTTEQETSTSATVGTTPTQTATVTAPTGSLSLEQCEAQGLAWRAVVNSGNSPTDCAGGTLESWCCTEPEILARFPTMAAALQSGNGGSNFTSFQAQNLVLYACSWSGGTSSTDPQSTHTFSFAKIVNGSTTYKTIFVNQVTPTTPTTDPSPPPCTQVTTPELNQTSLMLEDDGTRRDEFEETEVIP